MEQLAEKQVLRELASGESKAFELADTLDCLQHGIQALVDDDFTKCFNQRPSRPWNWNVYLFPLWVVGSLVRLFVLLPLRVAVLLFGWTLAGFGFFCTFVFLGKSRLKDTIVRKLVVFLCHVFVFSWTGVIKFHGTPPRRAPNQIYVANHTTMADVIVLMMQQPYAIVGQKHPGWLGFIQTKLLKPLGCLWFNRTDHGDRVRVSAAIKDHIADAGRPPLLIFPEGTCVNNEYCVQFKKGVFELGATIVPVAIKYNKIFCDAFWHSRKESFAWYLVRLMMSWCVVCDVYYLEPQTVQAGEDPVAFAERVQAMICRKAGLKVVPWDGYLKFLKLSPKVMEEQQRVIAESISKRLTLLATTAESPPAGREPLVPVPPAVAELRRRRLG